MSVQFGRWNCAGRRIGRRDLERAGKLLAPYGPDAQGAYIKDSVGILFHAFHTTQESQRESQPYITPSGKALCWDGRLDNRVELIPQLKGVLTPDSTEVAIVAAAYEEWGTGSFARLIGDWATSIWSPNSRSLILAKDPIGTHHLYYTVDQNEVIWSTILDPLVLCADKTFKLEEEYIAGWLSFFPATHLTPYVGIHAVPPSCFVRLEQGTRTVARYWDFDPGKKIRYRSDSEYEEHFRQAFAESVRRRLRSDRPVLAELSGGMDSSSIVCMADHILARGTAETPRLDTISYYDDSEPNWNERPYFAKVEEARGRVGCHIDVGRQNPFEGEFAGGRFRATPASGAHPSEVGELFRHCLISQGNDVVLSGFGGDEALGGVPTPVPELADLLSGARFRLLAHQLRAWALSKRMPWFHLLNETVRKFFPSFLAGASDRDRLTQWLHRSFLKRHRTALTGYEVRLRLFGPSPSFQENVATLDALRRQLACNPLTCEPPYEKRCPYLDRNLLEFVYAIPREQLVRPGQRRSLMRRALAGIVPREILNRKRKAFVVRAPMAAISAAWPSLAGMSQQMVSGSLKIVDPSRLLAALEMGRRGHEIPLVTLMRTLDIEYWLRNISRQKILAGLAVEIPETRNCQSPIVVSAEKNQN